MLAAKAWQVCGMRSSSSLEVSRWSSRSEMCFSPEVQRTYQVPDTHDAGANGSAVRPRRMDFWMISNPFICLPCASPGCYMETITLPLKVNLTQRTRRSRYLDLPAGSRCRFLSVPVCQEQETIKWN